MKRPEQVKEMWPMYSSIQRRSLIGLTPLLACGCIFGFGVLGKAQTIDDPDLRVLGPLINAGIRVGDSSVLIATLQGNDPDLAARAAYALGKLPKTRQAVAALTSAIRDARTRVRPYELDSWDSAAVYAARALVVLHEKDWIPVAQGRLGKMKHPTSKIQMSAVLASQGCYDGWPVVYENLLLLSPRFDYHALIAVPDFVGMKNSDDSELDLAAELAGLIPSMREDKRKLAISIVTEIRAKKKQ
jgi:hypothetical protein